jgi:uncharacterized caspase-like protein
LAAILATFSVAQDAPAAVRALVVGADYQGAEESLALANTLVDARAVVELLTTLRVDDVRLLQNPDSDGWRSAISDFAESLAPDDVAFLYYAGHAVQVHGENYFVAGNGDVLISAEEILGAVTQRARGTVFAIDACRNNPFRRPGDTAAIVPVRGLAEVDLRAFSSFTWADVSSASGLSQMNNVRGRNTVVFFSTEPGNVAVDGESGRGSPFANAVVRELARRQSLDAAIRRITEQVSDATRGQQAPWRQGDLGFPLFLAGQPRFPVP